MKADPSSFFWDPHQIPFIPWVSSVDLAIDRGMERVRRGGHSVPASTIRRRYRSGLGNFLDTYRKVVDAWLVFDNSQLGNPILLASQEHPGAMVVHRPEEWKRFQKGGRHRGEEQE